MSKPVVLIVDDEVQFTDMMEHFLESNGVKAHVANNATEALSQLSRLQPDLLLLDIMMPEVDGLLLIRLMRTNPELVNIPIVVSSAKPSAEGRSEALQAGADAFLPKPFSPDELWGTIGEYIPDHRTNGASPPTTA